MAPRHGNTLTKQLICPLCQSVNNHLYYQDKREYYRCTPCSLVFVPPQYFLTSAEEFGVYEQHENTVDDPGYRSFLGRLFNPLSKHVKPQCKGLDFGSGPGPTLSVMFEEAGHTMNIYDPYYAPDISVLDLQYDFITATEVVEHLHQPGKELEILWACLKPGGSLGIMTKRVQDQQAFSNWHYKNDPTHVCFFSSDTFYWLAKHLGANVQISTSDVVILTKQ